MAIRREMPGGGGWMDKWETDEDARQEASAAEKEEERRREEAARQAAEAIEALKNAKQLDLPLNDSPESDSLGG